jgi:hypothetical protein
MDYALRGASIGLVALALLWPALVNGFPLLFPDSLEYLWQSKGILGKLRGHDVPYWWYGAKRSEIYSASLAFLHHGAELWPIVVVQALLTAWVLWLVVRAPRLPRPVVAYVVIGGGLSALTGIGWYASSIMPDILGALVYLSLFLLVCVPGALLRWERALLLVVVFWGVTAHATHLLLAVGLSVLLTLLWTIRLPVLRERGRQFALVVGVVVFAMVGQLAVHQRLYGNASLFGRPPAFLMARLLADGPARVYLQQHCAASTWLICKHEGDLPTDGEAFLWSERGIWSQSDLAQQDELRREQMPLLMATLRAYPLQQAKQSMRNFGQSLITLGPWDYWNFATATPYYMEMTVPGLTPHYVTTKQSRNALPQRFSRDVQLPVVAVSLLAIVILLPGVWRRRDDALLSLTGVVLFTVVANAFLSGVLSGVFPRYQGRVVWMVVLLAGLLVYSRLVRQPID